MKRIVVEIDCTYTHCKDCKLKNGEWYICQVFQKELKWDDDVTVADFIRLPECIAMCSNLSFGDYVVIEQKRHGAKNEMYVHKVIGTSESNAWVDVPVQSPATESLHKEVMPVVSCICCGVCETEVRKYLIKDIRKV